MPVCVAQTVQKRTVRGATARHDGGLVSVACHRTPLAAQPPATRAWEGPRATRWWMCWSVGTKWPPAAASALPLLLSCRVRKLVAHRASRYLGWSSRQAPLAGALLPCRSAWRVAASSLECLGWPSRQAPLAGVLWCLGLDTLFLNGSKGTTEDLGGHPASLATGCCDCPCTSSGY